MPDEPLEPEHEESEEELERRLRRLLGEAEVADDEELDLIEQKLRDVESKLDAHFEERKQDDTFFDKEFDQKVADLHARAEAARDNRQAKKQERFREMKSSADSSRGAGVGLSIAYTIIGLPLAGAGTGWLIARGTGWQSAIGIGTVIGLVAGIGMAMLMSNRIK